METAKHSLHRTSQWVREHLASPATSSSNLSPLSSLAAHLSHQQERMETAKHSLHRTSQWVREHLASPATSSSNLSPLSSLAAHLSHQHIDQDQCENTPKRCLSLSDSSSDASAITPPQDFSQLVGKEKCSSSLAVPISRSPAGPCTSCLGKENSPLKTTVLPLPEDSPMRQEETLDGFGARKHSRSRFSQSRINFTSLRKSSTDSNFTSCGDTSRSASAMTSLARSERLPSLCDVFMASPSQSSVFGEPSPAPVDEDTRDSGFVESMDGQSVGSALSRQSTLSFPGDATSPEESSTKVTMTIGPPPSSSMCLGRTRKFASGSDITAQQDGTPTKPSFSSLGPKGQPGPYRKRVLCAQQEASTALLEGKRAFNFSPVDDSSPVKRKRSAFANLSNATATISEEEDIIRPSLLRCHSIPDQSWLEESANLFERNTDIIGDHTRPHVLPSQKVANIHDMKGVTGETVTQLLNGAFDHLVSEYHIIDCRYPYEYVAGHVRGARNLYEEVKMLQHFMTEPSYQSANCGKRRVLIFYCEFSSVRGPNLCKALRRADREKHHEEYPRLLYPEIYLMIGGYSRFFEEHKDYCDPCGYMRMDDKSHVQDRLHLKAKSKSTSDVCLTVSRRARITSRARRGLL